MRLSPGDPEGDHAHCVWRVSLPLAAIIIVAYGGFVLATVRQEAVVRSAQERYLQRGGLYLAELAGQAWPGASEAYRISR